MRAKMIAVIMMALVAAFTWLRYQIPLHHSPTVTLAKPHSLPKVDLAKLGSLPSVSPTELQSLIGQGLVYGIAVNAPHKIVLFLARTPNAPRQLTIRHWPPLRFAAIAVISQPKRTFSQEWNHDHQEIRWLRLPRPVGSRT